MRRFILLMLLPFCLSCNKDDVENININLLTNGIWSHYQYYTYNLPDGDRTDYTITQIVFNVSGSYEKTKIIKSLASPTPNSPDTLTTSGKWEYSEKDKLINLENFELECVRLIGEEPSYCPDIDFLIHSLTKDELQIEYLQNGTRSDPAILKTYLQ